VTTRQPVFVTYDTRAAFRAYAANVPHVRLCTTINDSQRLWWSCNGQLYGASPSRRPPTVLSGPLVEHSGSEHPQAPLR
jgi:hypothetical protein